MSTKSIFSFTVLRLSIFKAFVVVFQCTTKSGAVPLSRHCRVHRDCTLGTFINICFITIHSHQNNVCTTGLKLAANLVLQNKTKCAIWFWLWKLLILYY